MRVLPSREGHPCNSCCEGAETLEGQGGKEAAKRMAVEQAKRASGQLLTRVARGYLARKITQRKRKFIRAVLAAKHEVGLDCVNPDDLDKLADTIEEFQKNFTLTIPMEVISVYVAYSTYSLEMARTLSLSTILDTSSQFLYSPVPLAGTLTGYC